jgi:hypothetical protein
MPHPLVLALYTTSTTATSGARAVHDLGIGRDRISVVARTHDEAGALAGADIEDSRPASRLGELGGLVLAAIALVMPGIGPIVAAGPLSADLGEAAGHAAGSLSSTLTRGGVAHERAEWLQTQVDAGAVLLGVHVTAAEVAAVTRALGEAGATSVETASWPADE